MGLVESEGLIYTVPLSQSKPVLSEIFELIEKSPALFPKFNCFEACVCVCTYKPGNNFECYHQEHSLPP